LKIQHRTLLLPSKSWPKVQPNATNGSFRFAQIDVW
jgi:hypothetical protein